MSLPPPRIPQWGASEIVLLITLCPTPCCNHVHSQEPRPPQKSHCVGVALSVRIAFRVCYPAHGRLVCSLALRELRHVVPDDQVARGRQRRQLPTPHRQSTWPPQIILKESSFLKNLHFLLKNLLKMMEFALNMMNSAFEMMRIWLTHTRVHDGAAGCPKIITSQGRNLEFSTAESFAIHSKSAPPHRGARAWDGNTLAANGVDR